MTAAARATLYIEGKRLALYYLRLSLAMNTLPKITISCLPYLEYHQVRLLQSASLELIVGEQSLSYQLVVVGKQTLIEQGTQSVQLTLGTSLEKLVKNNSFLEFSYFSYLNLIGNIVTPHLSVNTSVCSSHQKFFDYISNVGLNNHLDFLKQVFSQSELNYYVDCNELLHVFCQCSHSDYQKISSIEQASIHHGNKSNEIIWHNPPSLSGLAKQFLIREKVYQVKSIEAHINRAHSEYRLTLSTNISNVPLSVPKLPTLGQIEKKDNGAYKVSIAHGDPLETARLLPLSVDKKALFDCSLAEKSNVLMVYQANGQRLIIGSLSLTEEKFVTPTLLIETKNQRIACEKGESLSLTNQKSQLLFDQDKQMHHLSNSMQIQIEQARVVSQSIKFMGNHLDHNSESMRFNSSDKVGMHAQSLFFNSNKTVLTAENTNQLASQSLAVNVSEKCAFRAEKNICIQSDNELVIEALDLNITSSSYVSLSGGNTSIELSPSHLTIKAKSCTSPVNVTGKIVFSRSTLISPSARKLIINKNTMPLPQQLLSVSFLTWKKTINQWDQCVRLLFSLSHVYHLSKVKINIYRTQTIKGKINTHPCLRNDRESYQLVDSIDIELAPQKANTHELDWQPSRPFQHGFKAQSYFRFQLQVNGVSYPYLSNAMQLVKRVSITVKGESKPLSIRLYRDLSHMIYPLTEETTKQYQGPPLVFDDIPIDALTEVVIADLGGQREIITTEGDATLPAYPIFSNRKESTEEHHIYLMDRPIIVDLTKKENGKSYLSQWQCDYFIEKKKNVLIFIHGYNIGPGEWARFHNTDIPITVSNPKQKTKGLRYWLTEIEKNINQSVNHTLDYRRHSRVLFVTWPGKPSNPLNYLDSVKASYESGRSFSELLKELEKQVPGSQYYVIAHSQGGAVITTALNQLRDKPVAIEQLVLWQSALDSSCLRQTSLSSVKKISVLYSKNDNILGELTDVSGKPWFLDERKVFSSTPLPELLAGVFVTCLGFQSLYKFAHWLSVPIHQLLSNQSLDDAWITWRENHPMLSHDSEGRILSYTLDEQLASYQHEKIIHKLIQVLEKRLQQSRPLIERVMRHLSSDLKRLSLKGLYLLLTHTHLLVDAMTIMCDKERIFIKEASGEQHLIENEAYMTLKLTTFLHATSLTSFDSPDALGWAGADKLTVNQLGKQLENVDITSWSYHHSHLLTPSPDLLAEVYRKQLFSRRHGMCLDKKG